MALDHNGTSSAVANPAAPSEIDLDAPELYFNRELSLLDFQRRVFDEAKDPRNPLLERIKFLSIVSSNLDEFFMVRVAGLSDQVASDVRTRDVRGMTPLEQLDSVRAEAAKLMREMRVYFIETLLPELAESGVRVATWGQLDDPQREALRDYFRSQIYPVLTPLAVDPGRPFPHISNLSLNLAVRVRRADAPDPDEAEEHFARIKVPNLLEQIVRIPGERGETHTYVWIEDIITANLDDLFPGYEVIDCHAFHVTRNTDYSIQEIEAGDLLDSVAVAVHNRRFGSVIRLVVDPSMPKDVLDRLRRHMSVRIDDTFHLAQPLGLNRVGGLRSANRPDLKYGGYTPHEPPQFRPEFGEERDDFVFNTIRETDVLLHHPFDSFGPVIQFLKQAAVDPQVLAIKMTLYRVGPNPPIVDALLDAHQNGKQVTVLVELKARFDEESNIVWTRRLEEEGVHVVRGLLGLKTHSKVAMVVRRENGRIRRYLHLATGNYNAVTANLYTDLGLLTCNEEMGEDVADLFNYLTGHSTKKDYKCLWVAPMAMRDRFEAMIRAEIKNAKEGLPARVIFKSNALVDQPLIRLLYEASQAGVKVDLLVRGICCLRPGVVGVSDNITVVSVVGRYLEHSRIYYFENAGSPQIYLGSADLMPRNLNVRVEVLFPVYKPEIIKHLKTRVLEVYLRDTSNARVMQADGSYIRAQPNRGDKPLSAQEVFSNPDAPES